MAKKHDKSADDATVAAEDGATTEQAKAKKSSKKSKKDKQNSENVTLQTSEDIAVPQLDQVESTSAGVAQPTEALNTGEKDKEKDKSKSKKRKNKEGDDVDPSSSKEKKERKKKRKAQGDATTEETAAVPAVQDRGVDMTLDTIPANPSGIPEEILATEGGETGKKKKKKSKKDKQHENDGGNDDTGMQVDEVQANEGEGEGEGETAQIEGNKEKKKKKKKKDKDQDVTADGENFPKKKEKKKKKDKQNTGTETQASENAIPTSHQRDSESPLPELRLPPIPPLPPANLPDYDNIDPDLRPVPRPSTTPVPPAAQGQSAPRSASMGLSGSTSILPRDPSLAPAPSSILPTMPVSAPSGDTGTAPKKRGRPKKVVPPPSEASTSAAPAAPVAPAQGQNGQRVTPAATAPVRASSISAPSLPPPARASAATISPRMPSSILPSASAPSAPTASAAGSSLHATSRIPPPPPSTSSTALTGLNPNTLARAAMNPDFKPGELPEGTTPLQPSENTESHQQLLASRWLSTKEMADLIEKEGLKVRSGKFSKAEDAALKLCIENYRQQQSLTPEQIDGIIFAKGKNTRADYGDFWTIVTRAVPDRALMSVYHHVKRLLQPGARKGPWTEDEDQKLKAAYRQYGPKWGLVAELVGRWENDCRDRWRAYVGPSENILKGKWSKEEEDKLRDVVRQVKADISKWKLENARGGGGAPIEDEPPGGSDMFWSRVASKMGSRSRHQCRTKWNDNMRNKLLTADGKPIRWAKRDTFILIMKIHSLQLTDEDEIAWKLLPDSHWNWWSPHVLHKRWGTLRTRAKKALGKPDATYTEIINCLKKEQDDIPRAEVKAFMAKKPDEVDGADEDGDGEEEDGDGDEEEISESTPVAGGSGNTPAVVQPSATRTTAQGEGRRRKTQDQSQFRTSEFVHSSDEED